MEWAAINSAVSDLGKLVAAAPPTFLSDDQKKGFRRLSAVIVGHCSSPMR
jgi:hypothetical protein